MYGESKKTYLDRCSCVPGRLLIAISAPAHWCASLSQQERRLWCDVPKAYTGFTIVFSLHS